MAEYIAGTPSNQDSKIKHRYGDLNMADTTREELIRKAIKAPLRSEISTADFQVMGISSTKMSEILFDIDVIIQSEITKAVREAESRVVNELVKSSIPAFKKDITIQEIELLLGKALKAKYDRMKEIKEGK